MESGWIMTVGAMGFMALIGLVAGTGLAVAGKFFHVKEDPRIESVKNILPGANCGGCGFAGCAEAAKAVVEGLADVDVCPVGGSEVVRQLSEIMGRRTAYEGPSTAVTGCAGGSRVEINFYYQGISDCRAEHLLYGGSRTCETGCLGKGSCVRACPFNVIRLSDDKLPVIDEARCRGCGRCIAVCPTGVLSLINFTGQLLHFNQTDECLAPCQQRCPAQMDIPRIIRFIREKNYPRALLKIKERNPLVLSTGRVCSHPCENICRRNIADEGVAICHLERFAGEWEINSGKRVPVRCAPSTDHRVAVIGGGPAGLSCAYFLRRLGHQPTIFEQKLELGGMLRYGITEYRLPKRLVDWDISGIIELGVTVKTNMTLGKDFFLSDLKSNGYQAVFIGMGAWIIPSLCVDGEYLDGVMSSLDFLSDVGSAITELTTSSAVVIGESNTAMDCARTCIRLGALSVTVLSPVTQKAMSARKNDVIRAVEEGVVMEFLSIPTRIVPDAQGCASHLEYCLVEPMEEKKEGVGKIIPNTEKTINASLIISAYDRKPDIEYLLCDQKDNFHFKASVQSTLDADEHTLLASAPDIFTAGDMHTGRSSVINAVAGGRKAARSIHYLLTRGTIPVSLREQKKINPKSILKDISISRPIPKVIVKELPVSLRKTSFIEEVQETISEKQALTEAARCLQCGTVCND